MKEIININSLEASEYGEAAEGLEGKVLDLRNMIEAIKEIKDKPELAQIVRYEIGID